MNFVFDWQGCYGTGSSETRRSFYFGKRSVRSTSNIAVLKVGSSNSRPLSAVRTQSVVLALIQRKPYLFKQVLWRDADRRPREPLCVLQAANRKHRD